ncbi:SPFH domain-containing protein [Romboutsia sp.]|uniref:SPFH domain-containing protein n=1 Tax=Romboutsia sp. TaxID=1965302 RepID=UPI002B68C10F|nr:SPFH domain-containing protein [Romboutsia sp.]HSQ89944.1 SPFH domain-containing protein [Romboutsia sp.]
MLKEEVNYEEKEAKAFNGVIALIESLLFTAISIGIMSFGIIKMGNGFDGLGSFLLILGILGMVVNFILLFGFKILNPKEAIVLVLFGKYYGTIKKEGFYWVNPFCSAVNPTSSSAINISKSSSTDKTDISANTSGKKVSLKAMTLNNEKQKVNDQLGNPIIIGVVVIWKVVDATKAVFNVDNYKTFLSIQCDSTIRNVARLYPYDVAEDGEEKSLRGSSQEIADKLKEELQSRVDISGIEITEVRITHLSYAPEIAAAMLQRQQAEAIIAARKKIVEGAVSMVEMALTNLSENDIVTLDEERKAAMVSNLLVVLCGNKDAQPIVNSGSIY